MFWKKTAEAPPVMTKTADSLADMCVLLFNKLADCFKQKTSGLVLKELENLSWSVVSTL